jgi:hypothetical protein
MSVLTSALPRNKIAQASPPEGVTACDRYLRRLAEVPAKPRAGPDGAMSFLH